MDGILFTSKKPVEEIKVGDWLEFIMGGELTVYGYVQLIKMEVFIVRYSYRTEKGNLSSGEMRIKKDKVVHSPLTLTQQQLKERKRIFIELALATNDEKMFEEAHEGVIEE
jgi:hypothetical protein